MKSNKNFIKSIILYAFIISLLNAQSQKVQFLASKVEKNGDITEASGDVLLYSPSYLISAKRAIYDEKNEIVELFDDVYVLKDDNQTSNSTYAKINLANNEILINNAFGLDKKSELWVQAKKVCSNEILLETNSSITSSCNVENPDWFIKYSRGELDKKDEYLRLYNSVMYINFPFIGATPVAYLPYFGYSTNKNRRSGLLTPELGYTHREGLYYQQPFYIATHDNWDLELNPQIRSVRGAGLYGTFRFVDSPYSQGLIRGGIFTDKKSYQIKENLKYQEHYGIELEYDRDKLAKYLYDGDYDEGLLLRVTQLNDVDYLNLRSRKESLAYSSLIHSKLNYYINTSEHYFGLYGNYYIDTAKIGTEHKNKATIQELPALQYHSYYDTFINKHFTYSFDAKYHNYTRSIGTKAHQYELYAPFGFNINLFDDWLNLSFNEHLYASRVDYVKNQFYVPYLNDFYLMDKKHDQYIRNWHEILLNTDLARAYDVFSGVYHSLNLELQYIKPGYKHGDISRYIYSSDYILEDNFINELDSAYTSQSVQASMAQYLFNNDGNKILRHYISQSYNFSANKLGDTKNKIDLYYANSKFYNKLVYSNAHKDFTALQSGVNFNYLNFGVDILHNYTKRYDSDADTSFVRSNYFQTNAAYKLPQDYQIFGAWAYDYERDNTKMWLLGLTQRRRCFSYGLYFRRDITPKITSAGPESERKSGVYVYFTFYPFGEFNYGFSLKEDDNS